jgi:wyosine [tRNA(Phe)-imidazoG37] synthetase (radical SAM superfamily)
MDAFTAAAYTKVNRPHGSVRMDEVIGGLKKFAAEYKGRIWLEIMAVSGMNDSDADIFEAKKVLDTIPGIEKIQINTVVRSRAESFADPVPDERMKHIASMLGSRAEVIGKFKGSSIHTIDSIEDAMMDALKRRPMTLIDFEMTLGVKRDELETNLNTMIDRGLIVKDTFNGKDFYKSKN